MRKALSCESSMIMISYNICWLVTLQGFILRQTNFCLIQVPFYFPNEGNLLVSWGNFCGKKELRDWGSLLIQMIIFGFITAIVIGTTGFADDKIGTLDARVDGCSNIRSLSYSTTTRTTSRWRHSALGPGPLHCFCIVPHLWLANDNLRETLKSFGHLFQNVITRIVVGISWVPCQRYLRCAQEESE